MLIYMELFSKEWVKELKLSEKTPIEYTDKEDITSIAFYRDKDCKEAVKGFVESGQTIYVRVTTRGLDDSNIALFVYRYGMVTEEETSINGSCTLSNKSAQLQILLFTLIFHCFIIINSFVD